jgi:hypothetical protein
VPAGTTATASSLAVGLGEGLELGDAVGYGDSLASTGPLVGSVVASAVGDGAAGTGVGRGVGFGVAFGVGVGVGSGAGAGVITTVPAAIESVKWSRLSAEMVALCVPSGSLPDQRYVTPLFQSDPPTCVIARVAPAIRTRTQSAADPSRLRYVTLIVIVVVG